MIAIIVVIVVAIIAIVVIEWFNNVELCAKIDQLHKEAGALTSQLVDRVQEVARLNKEADSLTSQLADRFREVHQLKADLVSVRNHNAELWAFAVRAEAAPKKARVRARRQKD